MKNKLKNNRIHGNRNQVTNTVSINNYGSNRTEEALLKVIELLTKQVELLTAHIKQPIHIINSISNNSNNHFNGIKNTNNATGGNNYNTNNNRATGSNAIDKNSKCGNSTNRIEVNPIMRVVANE